MIIIKVAATIRDKAERTVIIESRARLNVVDGGRGFWQLTFFENRMTSGDVKVDR